MKMLKNKKLAVVAVVCLFLHTEIGTLVLSIL